MRVTRTIINALPVENGNVALFTEGAAQGDHKVYYVATEHQGLTERALTELRTIGRPTQATCELELDELGAVINWTRL